MMMGQQYGWSMRQGKRKMMGKGDKDRLVCVRFMNRNDEIKWLKLKIPGILIRELEAAHCPSQSKRARTTRSSSSSADTGSLPHHHVPDVERELAECIDRVVSQRCVKCKVDPKFNGPFTIPFPQGRISLRAAWASIGSVMYSLGGYKDHFDPKARRQVIRELSGFHPTTVGRIPREFVSGPPITGGHRLTAPPPTTCTSSDNVCYYFHSCDISKPDLQWHVSNRPLTSPRLAPILVSLENIDMDIKMLFAFGGNCPTDADAPFAEVFDFNNGYWEPLPPPPFGRLGACELYVFPLPTSCRILVLGILSGIQYTFDVLTWYWRPLEDNTFDMTFIRLIRPFAKPVLSEFNEAIYWVNKAGRLSVYSVMGDCKYYQGYIPDLELEMGGSLLKHLSLALLPLSEHLVGLLWRSDDDDYDGDLICSCVLHLTILHVSFLDAAADDDDDDDRDGPKITLTASAVACLSFRLEKDFMFKVIDAYLV